MTAPAAVKGPRLTLMVSSAHLARLEAAVHGPQTGLETPLSSIQTPSSTAVEYGDHLEVGLSAAERADRLFAILSSPDRLQQNDDIEAATPISETPISEIPQFTRKPRPNDSKLVNDRLSRFLQNVHQASGDPNKELVRENRGLHQRVTVLQRNEEHLIRDKNDLTSHVVSLKETHDMERRRLEDELSAKKAALEARIRELEDQVARQSDKISQLSAQVDPTRVMATLSDAEIAAWITARAASWSTWVDEFAHPSPSRLSELHEIQRFEVHQGIRGFVKLNINGKLPEPLASLDEKSPINITRLLLNGMLTEFIINEALSSPLWIFEALQKQSYDLDSPAETSWSGSMSSAGFRLDLSAFSSGSSTGMAPLASPFGVPPAPTTARSISMLSPGRAPPMFASLHAPPTLKTKGLSTTYGLPTKSVMRELIGLLSKTQPSDDRVNSWRAQLISMLADGGLSRDASHPSLANNEDGQMLANARREYARRLAERFLESAARFLLANQNAQGIAKLEGRLVNELDLILRFSAHAWSRPTPLHFLGLSELGYKTHLDVTEIYDQSESESDEDEGREVVMVVHPAVGTMKKVGGSGKVWVKAHVIVKPDELVSQASESKGKEAAGDDSITPKAEKPSVPLPTALNIDVAKASTKIKKIRATPREITIASPKDHGDDVPRSPQGRTPGLDAGMDSPFPEDLREQ